jgi:hypothetical protein
VAHDDYSTFLGKLLKDAGQYLRSDGRFLEIVAGLFENGHTERKVGNDFTAGDATTRLLAPKPELHRPDSTLELSPISPRGVSGRRLHREGWKWQVIVRIPQGVGVAGRYRLEAVEAVIPNALKRFGEVSFPSALGISSANAVQENEDGFVSHF